MRLRSALALGLVGSVATGVVLLACSSFDEEPDTTPDSGDAATAADVSPDAPPDAGAVTDTGADVLAPPKGFCSGTDRSVCSQFSVPPITNGGFNIPLLDDGGVTASIDNAIFLSPPGSLKASAPNLASGETATGLLGFKYTTVPKTVTVSVALYVDEIDPTGSAADFLSIYTGGTFVSVGMQGGRNCVLKAVGLVDASATAASHPCGVLAENAWTQIRLTVTLPNKALLSINGANAYDGTIPPLVVAPTLEALIGLRTFGPVAAQTLFFDDVKIQP